MNAKAKKAYGARADEDNRDHQHAFLAAVMSQSAGPSRMGQGSIRSRQHTRRQAWNFVWAVMAMSALFLSSPGRAKAQQSIFLQALVPTSGGGVEKLLDGSGDAGWRPVGDPRDEGVLFRFESPTAVNRVRLSACSAKARGWLTVYIDGQQLKQMSWGRDDRSVVDISIPLFDGEPRSFRSLFLKMGGLTALDACWAEVSFHNEAGKMDVNPPRKVSGSVEASSTLRPIDAYHPSYLFDTRTDFGWVEGAAGLGRGETLTIELGREKSIRAIELWNGYQRSPDHFAKNARLSSFELQMNGSATIVQVEDEMGAQKLEVPMKEPAKAVRLKLRGAVPGSKYQDLVISELRFWDEKGPFVISTDDREERRAVLLDKVSGQALEKVIDCQWRNICPSNHQQRLKLRSNHSFVWYDEKAEAEREIEIFDGTWVVRKQAMPWSQIQLYGRRHVSSTSWTPYGGQQSSQSVRIGGGRVSLARVGDMGKARFQGLIQKWKKRGVARQVACIGQPGYRFEDLVHKGAVVFRGASITSLLWKKAPNEGAEELKDKP